MEQKEIKKDQTIKVSISKDHNLKIEQWIKLGHEKESNSRLTKQKVLECALNKLTENDVLTLAQKNKDRKALVLKYLKEDSEIQNPKALIALLQKELTATDK